MLEVSVQPSFYLVIRIQHICLKRTRGKPLCITGEFLMLLHLNIHQTSPPSVLPPADGDLHGISHRRYASIAAHLQLRDGRRLALWPQHGTHDCLGVQV